MQDGPGYGVKKGTRFVADGCYVRNKKYRFSEQGLPYLQGSLKFVNLGVRGVGHVATVFVAQPDSTVIGGEKTFLFLG